MTALDIPGIGELKLSLDIDLLVLEDDEALALADHLDALCAFLRHGRGNAGTIELFPWVPQSGTITPTSEPIPVEPTPKKKPARKSPAKAKPAGKRKRTNTPVDCDVCGETFGSPAALGSHRRTHKSATDTKSATSSTAASGNGSGFAGDLGPISKTSTELARERAAIA